jgi:hypothetical protein
MLSTAQTAAPSCGKGLILPCALASLESPTKSNPRGMAKREIKIIQNRTLARLVLQLTVDLLEEFLCPLITRDSFGFKH